MARRESYNPLLKSYTDSEKINAVSLGAEVLYVRLIAASDDRGLYYGEPRWILAKLFTSRSLSGEVTATEAAKWLDELEAVGLISRYRIDSEPSPARARPECGTYLEMVEVYKRLRSDIKPDHRFPQRTCVLGTSTERIRAEDGPNASHHLHLQPNPATDSPAKASSGVFKKLTVEDLRDSSRLLAWYELATSRRTPVVQASDQNRVRVFGAAERALEHGDEPIGLFAWLVAGGHWEHITGAQEDRASARLRAYDAQQRGTSEFSSSLVTTLKGKRDG